MLLEFILLIFWTEVYISLALSTSYHPVQEHSWQQKQLNNMPQGTINYYLVWIDGSNYSSSRYLLPPGSFKV